MTKYDYYTSHLPDFYSNLILAFLSSFFFFLFAIELPFFLHCFDHPPLRIQTTTFPLTTYSLYNQLLPNVRFNYTLLINCSSTDLKAQKFL
jgi:hypothetical protein